MVGIFNDSILKYGNGREEVNKDKGQEAGSRMRYADGI